MWIGIITTSCYFSAQIGLAVGDTQKEREKAEFTKLKVWVSNFLYRE